MLDLKTALVLGDAHVPYHDPLSLNIALQVAKDISPDIIVQVGDFNDFYSISRFAKNPDRASGTNLQRELDIAGEVLDQFSNIAPIVMIESNHAARLEKYLKEKAPGLHGLRNLTVERLLNLEKRRVDYRKTYNLGKLLVLHGDEVSERGSSHACRSVQTTVERLNCSIMMGHVHKLGMFSRTTEYGGVQYGYEVGCLCLTTDVEYVRYPNWQPGFAVVKYMDAGDKRFFVSLVPIEKILKGKGREAYYNNKYYTAV